MTDPLTNGSTEPEPEPEPDSDHDSDHDNDSDHGGVGTEGTIPANPDGLAAGLSEEGSNFNQEEDPETAVKPPDTPSPDLV